MQFKRTIQGIIGLSRPAIHYFWSKTFHIPKMVLKWSRTSIGLQKSKRLPQIGWVAIIKSNNQNSPLLQDKRLKRIDLKAKWTGIHQMVLHYPANFPTQPQQGKTSWSPNPYLLLQITPWITPRPSRCSLSPGALENLSMSSDEKYILINIMT